MSPTSGCIAFDAILQKLPGKIAWTVLYVPADLLQRLGGTAGGGRLCVRGRVDQQPFRGTLLPSREGYYLVFNAPLREACGKSRGERVRVELQPDTGERPVEVPEVLAAALKQDPVAQGAFNRLPPYRRREEITRLTSAKQEATRQRRLAQLLQTLSAADAK